MKPIDSISKEKKTTSIVKSQKYETNPFINGLTIKTKTKRITVARGGTIIDMSTGEVEGITEISQIIEVDDGQFIKLFTKDLAVWFDLNKSGLRVFGAILGTMQNGSIGKDIVYIDHSSQSTKEFGISKATFYRGIEELLEKKFIARHKSLGLYFINPAIFFNGNRARFIKEYSIKSRASKVKKHLP